MIINDLVYQRTWDNSSYAANYTDLINSAPRMAYMQARARANETLYCQAEVARVVYSEAFEALNEAYASYELAVAAYDRTEIAYQSESSPYTDHVRTVRWDATTSTWAVIDQARLVFNMAVDAYVHACDAAVKCTLA
jgi:hypothetical protein